MLHVSAPLGHHQAFYGNMKIYKRHSSGSTSR